MADQEHRQPEDTEEAPAQAETPESEAPAGEAAASEELQKRVESLEAALGAAKEQVLRAQADAQNAQRRAQQDVEKAHKYGQEKLVADLLPVVDNLERALAAIDTTDEAMKPVIEGIELTHKSFIDSLKGHQVEPIDPQGEPFDPQLHQAMTMVANPEVEPNTVVEVFQKGYTLHGRLVRPAMVVVSKAE